MPFDAEALPKTQDQIMLEKARAKVAAGWTQRQCADWGSEWKIARVCMGGAYLFGVDYKPGQVVEWGCDSHQAFARLLGFKDTGDMANWNDRPGRTQAEVLARFDQAIAREATR